jgi:hypothetical protein
MVKKIFILNKQMFIKNTAFNSAGVIFDLNTTSTSEIKDFLKETEREWIIVDYNAKQNVIFDTAKDSDFYKISQYFEK